MPATTFFTHDGSGLSSAIDILAPEGIVGVSGFAGAGGGVPGDVAATLGLSATGGVDGSQAVVLTLSNTPATDFAFGGVSQFIGGAIAEPTDFIASVDVLAPVGVTLSLRVESPFGPTHNGFALNFVGTGAYETISGIVGTGAYQTISGVVGTDLTPIAGGTFDSTAIANILIATNFNSIPIGADQEIFIDNFSFQPIAVPEPNSFLVLTSLGAICAVRRRRW